MLPLKCVHVRNHLLHVSLNGLLGLARNEREDLLVLLILSQMQIHLGCPIYDSVAQLNFWRFARLLTNHLRNNSSKLSSKFWCGR